MKVIFPLVILFLNFCNSDAKISESLKVTLPHGGGITGRYLTSFRGHGIRAFMGIPYAEPPVGNLRFSNPVPKSPWSDYLQTVSNDVICPQPNFLMEGQGSSGKEDCLYLDVYAPQFPNTSEPLPVMVYMHGGGWSLDSASFYRPDFFLDHDVILVIGNYRLGALGFLSTNTSDSPGNFGIKDQVEILKWVQANIGVFGGNRDQVTIFGESAGAGSVAYLLTSPSTKGLFHRAIAQSGNYFDPWAFLDNSLVLERTKKYANVLGCTLKDENWNELVVCLRGKSVDDLVKFSNELSEWDTEPVVKFPPTIEYDTKGGVIFENPKNIKENHGLKIPLLIGLTRDEGLARSAGIKSTPRLADDLEKRWEDILPIILSYNILDQQKQVEFTKAITDFYFKGNKGRAAIEMTQNFTNMCTDFMFFKGFNEYLQQRLELFENAAPTFVYKFAHSGEGTFTDLWYGPSDENFGVSHVDDLLYLFPLLHKPIFQSAPSKTDIFMQETMVKLWVNFATSGNPTPVENVDVDWTPANKFPLDYLRIGNYGNPNEPLFAMEKDFWPERSDFLKHLFEKNH
ncbi:juvenile hormone esterase-like [Phlebotomus papatasi]|uniref:juvenile hormone esterase-like n=1 Tax=Phlebotomus papatasi TaxID=29031 RepID=UPI002483E867|nr:juvenile hormone esterase-like [Phlebotomus papatasi]